MKKKKPEEKKYIRKVTHHHNTFVFTCPVCGMTANYYEPTVPFNSSKDLHVCGNPNTMISESNDGKGCRAVFNIKTEAMLRVTNTTLINHHVFDFKTQSISIEEASRKIDEALQGNPYHIKALFETVIMALHKGLKR